MNACEDQSEPLGESPELPWVKPVADRPICFLDTDTLGLDPDAPIWEFACIRTTQTGSVYSEFTIAHDPQDWIDTLPPQFQQDYRDRYDPRLSISPDYAVAQIDIMTRDAIIVGCNPSFDVDSRRLAGLLRRYGVEPGWHYHPLDTASMALSWLWARGVHPPQPWKSDQLSRLIGVDPAQFDRHTAMGDAQWCRAQWYRMRTAPAPAGPLETWHGVVKVTE